MDLTLIAAFGDQIPLTQFKPSDRIHILSFSHNGAFVASGDEGGRVVVFSVSAVPNHRTRVQLACQIHAHQSEFDFFRSELSEPKITSMKWLPIESPTPMLLTCNAHDAKLWRLDAQETPNWLPSKGDTLDTFVPPTAGSVQKKYCGKCVRTFTDIRTEYLVDLQVLSDQRSFLMVDVDGVKLWDMERDVPSVTLCHVGSNDPEIITSAVDPAIPFAFLVADDNGECRILDMRQQSEDLTPSIKVQTAKFGTIKNAEGAESVGSVSFTGEGTNFIVRTFFDVQKWDIRQTSKPVEVMNVHEYPTRMKWLISEGYTKEQFRTAVMPNGNVVTGTYGIEFLSWDPASDEMRRHRATTARSPPVPVGIGRDFATRVSCAEAHPTKGIVAVVSTAALYLYQVADK